ncbi:FixH family protein [Bacillus taeanensis]|uniref:YtkA-like domain-containing protein n=1 Tax=Bacillus taeanensis TaxID=273032 RepID=A0A366Y0G1_9BACI|nr:FixH family protein [Bacillus taeanensis]RBW69651.1 hypothetical protein DS031_10530 [Bacillus taeanensis]
MKNILILVFSIAALVLSGCGNDDTQNQAENNEQLPQLIEVNLSVNPENPQPNEEVTLQAVVTQGSEKVDDADEVAFEVWKDGEEEHEKIEGNHQGGGLYSITKTFKEAGVYYVVSHVTARDMHNMPKKEFVVGNIEKPQETTDEEAHHEGNHEEHDADDSHSEDDHAVENHHSGGLVMQFMSENKLQSGKETVLTVHLLQDDSPLSEADVRFEVWKENDEKHQFIEAAEGTKGEYKANTSFSASGKYYVKVHVKKDDLHDHQENTITVQ